ncbi:MAG: DUF308 domain-containing protein [Bacilli bacterium]
MGRKKKENVETQEEVVRLEKIGENKKDNNVSEVFYYILGLVISFVLIFATEELLSTINYLFVIIFGVVAIIQLLLFVIKKEYEKKNYTELMTGIILIWLAIFTFKYGDFLFLEMLPVLASLLLFIMGVSSLTKYLDSKKIANLIIAILSLTLGIVLVFVPKDIMYIFFKITGVYMILLIVLDLIDYIKNRK